MKSPRGFIWPLLAVIIAAGLVGGLYWYSERQNTIDDNNPSVKTLQQEVQGQADCASQHLPPDCNADSKANPNPTANQDVSFRATPLIGPAPLTVQFSGSAAEFADSFVELDYGDGTVNPDALSYKECDDNDICPVSASYIYTMPGVYTATLKEPKGNSFSKTLTITVTENKNALIAEPALGTAPLDVQFIYPFSQDRVAPTIIFGDGSQSSMLCSRNGCQASHTYGTEGTFTAILSSGGELVATTTVTASLRSCDACAPDSN